MRLKAKTERNQTTFTDGTGKVIYTLTETLAKAEGSGEQQAKMAIAEYVVCKKVLLSDGGSGCGWSNSILERLRRRMDDLKTRLMELCISELFNLHITEAQNGD